MTRTISTACSLAAADRVFHDSMRDRYTWIEPDSLVCDEFPTSFTSSAGPSLATRALIDQRPWDGHLVRETQPCIRYWDIPLVGDGQHLSFFEMACVVSRAADDRPRVLSDLYASLVDGFGIDPNRLYATVYSKGPVAGVSFSPDEVAHQAWSACGLEPSHIVGVNGSEGFVANRHEAVGGYRTELHVERFENCQAGCQRCVPGASDCNRFLEVATAVTYSFAVDLDLTEPIRPIDRAPVHAAGLGLERVAMVAQGGLDIACVDVIDLPSDILMRHVRGGALRDVHAVVDHLRALGFLAAHDLLVLSGKKHKGRRWILNRYARSVLAATQRLGLEIESVTGEVLEVILDLYEGRYPQLGRDRCAIRRSVQAYLERTCSLNGA